MEFKNGVKVFGVQPIMWPALMVCKQVYAEHDNLENFVITSTYDGDHKLHSDHYKGYAVDLRIWNFSTNELYVVRNKIRSRLTDEFKVILEEDHFHLAYSPRTM